MGVFISRTGLENVANHSFRFFDAMCAHMHTCACGGALRAYTFYISHICNEHWPYRKVARGVQKNKGRYIFQRVQFRGVGVGALGVYILYMPHLQGAESV